MTQRSLANETEVKAQIKLKFQNVNGKELVCTRSISLTKKKTTYTQKTLESLLVTKNESGEQVSISSKCAELDLAMPEQLGVSKAILDNVIFCHQEESYWPLSEPAVLKKKFDEIFASTRYSKALENVKALRKNQAIQIKLHTNDLEHLRFNKEKASEISQNIADMQTKLSDVNRRRSSIETSEIAKVSAEIRSLEVEVQELQKLKTNLSRLEIERSNIEKNIREFQDIQVLSESMNELYSILENYNESFRRIAKESKTLEDKIPLHEEDLQAKESILLDLLREKGKLEAEQQAIERKKRDKKSIAADIGTFFKHYNLSHADEIGSSPEDAAARLKIFIEALSRTVIRTKQKEKRLNTFRHDLDDFETNSLVVAIDEQYNSWETKRKSASENIKMINLQGEVRMNINVKKTEANRINGKYNSILDQLKAEFLHLTGKTLAQDNIGKELISSIRLAEEEKLSMDKKLENIKNDVSLYRSKLDVLQQSEVSKEKEVSKKRNVLQKVCKEEEFLTRMDEIEKSYEEESSSEKTFSNAANIFRKYVQIFEACKQCPLCLRGFSSEGESQAFMQKLQQTLAKIPNEEDQLLIVQEKAKLRKTFEDLKPVWADIKRIRETELPSISKEKADVQLSLEDIKKKLPEAEKQLLNVKQKLESFQALRRRFEESQQLKTEEDILHLQISSLEAELLGESSTKSTSELQEELDLAMQKCKTLAKEKDDHLIDLRRKKDRIKDQESLIKDLANKLQNLENEVKERSRLDSEIKGLKADIEKCQYDLGTKEDSRSSMEPQLFEVRESLQNLREKKSMKERENNVKMQKAQQFLASYRNIETDLLRASSVNPEEKLVDCERKTESCKTEIESCKKEITKLKEKIANINQDHAEISLMLRNVQDNLKLRQLQQELKTQEQQAIRLKRDIANLNGEETERTLKRLTGRYETLCNELAVLSGEAKQMEIQISRLRNEIEKDYKDVFSRYVNQAVQVKAETMANDDLDKYSKALENAILKYHSMKMEEINKIIRELWVNTYKGNDIETIEIRSDTENVKGNRSYNYRVGVYKQHQVVMIKEQTELDMRGRCSAGQKVLAALIIRLALAETFCLNCGILALDEPTTNLDTDNSESLAESLVSIIKMRRQQKNFQLIVITHDEDFMQLLGKSEYADYYWRVTKNYNMHSVIEKQRVTG
ncbi:DNA repair protein rad50 [Dinochytrium kinnereticum]|nr:DNA repair protein rad50 [Dinochytrium kinnereticum]